MPSAEPSGLLDVTTFLNSVRPAVPPQIVPDSAALDDLAGRIRAARRGLLVCGPATARDAADPDDLADLADVTGFPVVAEPASQLRFGSGPRPGLEIDAFAALIEVDAFVAEHRPDLVIRLGRPPTASAWHAALNVWQSEHWVLAPYGWPVAGNRGHVVHGPLDAAVPALTRALRRDLETRKAAGPSPSLDEWREGLRRANAVAWQVIDASLEGGFSEGAAVRGVVDKLPRGSVLALGNSLPIREVERFVPAADRGLHVWSQRGANGIDGLISGAAGAAASGRPTTLIVGDVSFAHDVGGLAAARDRAPLTVVVLNNGGGRIFERLPLAEQLANDRAFDTWLTPPELDIEAACRAFSAEYARAADGDALGSALDQALGPRSGHRCCVIEVIVPEGGTTLHQRQLRDHLAEALAQ
jgi:2-succinyl-5-enolpyruvyl-6-hydroxy-3-cyclohexene-1-carboxylate synthase